MKFDKIGTIAINGVEWEYGWGDCGTTKGRKDQGKCDYANKRIVIAKKRKCNLLDVVCHEVVHARFPDLKEDAVEEIGNLVDEVYRKMDYTLLPYGKTA